MPTIVIISQYFKPEIGAPQNRLYELAVGLKSLGWNVSVITALPNYPFGKIFKEYSRKLYCREFIEGMEIRRYWLYASNSKMTIPRIISMISFSISIIFSIRYLKSHKFDYTFVESPPLLLGLTGHFLAKLSKSRFIFNVSDLWPLSAKELGYINDGVLYKGLNKLENFIYNKSFICLGQSQEIVTHIKNRGARCTFLFRNGVDPERFSKNRKKGDGKHLKIIYTGLLGTAQGILEICKQIDFQKLGLQFHIYGGGNEKEQIVEYLNNFPNRGILYKGIVNRDEIPLLLSEYTVTLIPLARTIYGAVPSKIFESMAAGLPIIFSGGGEGGRIIDDNKLGWTSPPGDYEALRKNLEKMSVQTDLLDNFSKNCITTAENLFNRPEQIKELSRFLISFIS